MRNDAASRQPLTPCVGMPCHTQGRKALLGTLLLVACIAAQGVVGIVHTRWHACDRHTPQRLRSGRHRAAFGAINTPSALTAHTQA